MHLQMNYNYTRIRPKIGYSMSEKKKNINLKIWSILAKKCTYRWRQDFSKIHRYDDTHLVRVELWMETWEQISINWFYLSSSMEHVNKLTAAAATAAQLILRPIRAVRFDFTWLKFNQWHSLFVIVSTKRLADAIVNRMPLAHLKSSQVKPDHTNRPQLGFVMTGVATSHR